MNMIDQLVLDYAGHANADYIGLWMIVSSLKDGDKVQPDPQVKTDTLYIAKKLMELNIFPGKLVKNGGFDFWEGTLADKLARIEAEWPKTGVPTLISGNCWFALKK